MIRAEAVEPRADDDAERLAELRQRYTWQEAERFVTGYEGDIRLLLRLLDSRDAALREAREEIVEFTGHYGRASVQCDELREENERLRAPESSWPAPTPAMLADPLFNAIWSAIKTWDINVPKAYGGYCGATGNHARAIYDAITPPPATADSGTTAVTAASAEDVELARRVIQEWQEKCGPEGWIDEEMLSLRDIIAAALAARGAEGERAGIVECLQLVSDEYSRLYHECEAEFDSTKLRQQMAITTFIEARLRAILPPAAPEK